MARQRLVDPLRLNEFHEAQLDGIVAIFVHCAPLHHHAWARLQHRARHRRAIIGEDLRHAELDSENSIDCHRVYSLLWPCRGADCLALLHRLHYACSRPNALISTSTPGGKSSFISASTVSGVGSRISIKRLCVRISNCSRDFLSTCGERSTVQRLIVVGRGIGPATSAPVRFAVSTISRVDWSRMRWSNAFKRIRILSPCLMCFLFVSYSTISVTAPAPTVWPPSRMAKRKPFSSATGVISVTTQLTLSPGITISTPVGSATSPVTSVVRK